MKHDTASTTVAKLMETVRRGYHVGSGAVRVRERPGKGAAIGKGAGGQVIAKQAAGAVEKVKPVVLHTEVEQKVGTPQSGKGRHLGKDNGGLQRAAVGTHQPVAAGHNPEVPAFIHEEVFQRLPHSPRGQKTIRTLQHALVRQVHRHQCMLVFHPNVAVGIDVGMMIAAIGGKGADLAPAIMEIGEACPVVKVELAFRGDQHPPVRQLRNVSHLIA